MMRLSLKAMCLKGGLAIALLLTGFSVAGSSLVQLPAIAQIPTTDARQTEADRLFQQGIQQFQTSQFEAALQSWEKALTLYRQIKDRKGEGNALSGLGLAYYVLGNYAKAIDYHEQSLAIAREIKDRLGEGNALGNLGNAYGSLGNYAKAIDYHEQSLAIQRQIKDRLGQGKLLGNLGVAQFYNRQFSQAEQSLRQAIQVYETIRLDRLSEEDKISLFETQSNSYRTLQQVLIAQNQPESALTISEWGRSKALIERLTQQLNPKVTLTTSQAPSLSTLTQIARSQNSTLVEYSLVYDREKLECCDVPREKQDKQHTHYE
jgi:tetratricopeptide (TPR) repeat protein